MIPETSFPKRYWYGPYEGDEARSLSGRHGDRGVEQAAAGAIRRLRSRVIALMWHRRREAGRAAQDASRHGRLARYREVDSGATWTELE